MDTEKSLAIKGLTVTFVDLHQDGRLNTGDCFKVSGSWIDPNPDMALALLRVDGGMTRTIASVTLEPPTPFGP